MSGDGDIAGRRRHESTAMSDLNAERPEPAPEPSDEMPECLEFLAEQIWSMRELVDGLRKRADSTDYSIAVEELRFATDAIERAYEDLRCFVASAQQH